MEDVKDIYFNVSKEHGKLKCRETGLGWKPSNGGSSVVINAEDIAGAQWSHAAKGCQIKVFTRDSKVILLDGFKEDVSVAWSNGIATCSLY